MQTVLFRNRLFRELFPAGVAAAFILGVALASRFAGSGGIAQLLVSALVIGAVGSAALFVAFKLFDRKKKNLH